MDLGLTDKVAIVTGASEGIGLAITRALVGEGAQVVAGALTGSEELTALTDTGRVKSVAVDLSMTTGPVDLVAAAAELGRLDILVNNVGELSPRLSGFLESLTTSGSHRSRSPLCLRSAQPAQPCRRCSPPDTATS